MSEQLTVRTRNLDYSVPKPSEFNSTRVNPDGSLNFGDSSNVRIVNSQSSGTFDRLHGLQTTQSEGHRFRGKNPGYDVGGPFNTNKYVVRIIGNSNVFMETAKVPGDVYNQFSGCMLPANPTTMAWPPDIRLSNTQLNTMGATAVARCSPVNPIVNAATFLGELIKDGLPDIPGMHAWEKRAKILALAGDQFLNVVFGWNPLVADIKASAKAVRHAQAVMEQFERDAGKTVRRNYTFDPVESISRQTVATGVYPYIGSTSSGRWNASMGQGNVICTTKTVRKVWFSGAFTYHAPKGLITGRSMGRSADELHRVFGLDLTPETLWNLTPWSWAIDWVTNAGDVTQNLSQAAQFGLVMRYGYVMEHCVSTNTYSWHRTGDSPQSGQPFPREKCPLIEYRFESKRRIGANPFGFGLTWDGLSTAQQAIAAALGLSRSRN